jgi:hypothetical protein
MRQTIVLLFAFVLALSQGIQAQETGMNGTVLSVASSLNGDVDGDGQITIADASEIIDIILEGSTNTAGDVDGDGRVTIADLSDLIDIILVAHPAQPSLTVTPTVLDMGYVPVGTSKSASIAIAGANLTGPITVSIQETYGGEFSVNKTSLPSTGGTVIVTYTPEGSHSSSAQLTFQSGSEIVRVIVNGRGEDSPLITINPESINFGNVALGSTKTAAFMVKGTGLTGNLTLASTNHVFTVNPTTISRTDAANGVIVSVTYTPDYEGSNGGYIIISGGGAESVRVNLLGKCTQPTIIAPDTLYFDDSSTTKTFTVKGTDLVNNLLLTTNNSWIAVSPTTITATQAANGCTVSVTIHPTAGSNMTGYIDVIYGETLIKRIVVIYRRTQPPTITVSPTVLAFGNTPIGYSKRKTFTVMGTDLTGNLTVNTTNKTVYSVSPTTITPEQAANGATVTVTYTPNTASSHVGTVTVSGGASSKTVTLSGKGIEATPN